MDHDNDDDDDDNELDRALALSLQPLSSTIATSPRFDKMMMNMENSFVYVQSLVQVLVPLHLDRIWRLDNLQQQ